jgi:hypothetical protein
MSEEDGQEQDDSDLFGPAPQREIQLRVPRPGERTRDNLRNFRQGFVSAAKVRPRRSTRRPTAAAWSTSPG